MKCSFWRFQVTRWELIFAFCVTGAIHLEACQCKRVVFSWQAQHFLLMHVGVAWQAQHFVACPKCFFHESHWQGCANMTQWAKLVEGAAFGDCLEKLRKPRKK